MVLSWKKLCFGTVCLVAVTSLVYASDRASATPTLANQMTQEPVSTVAPQGPLLILLADDSPSDLGLLPQNRSACPNDLDQTSCHEWIAHHLSPSGTNFAGTKFKVNYNPSGQCSSGLAAVEAWPDEAKVAFEYALTIWAALIESSATFTVNACWGPMQIENALGGAASYSLYRNFHASARPDTLYPVALANQMAGTDINGADPEFYAEFNSSSNWYFDTDQVVPVNQYDFISVVLHEITHGLGFYGSMNVSSGLGEWGYSNSPTIFDHFAIDDNGRKLLDYTNQSQELARALTGQSGGVYFDGPAATAANAGGLVKLYTPTVWFSGSSFSHLDDIFERSQNELMVHRLTIGRSIHNPGPITLGMMQDIGWDIDTTFSIPTVTPTPTTTPTPTSTPTPSATPPSAATPTTTPIVTPTLPVSGSDELLLRVGTLDARNLNMVTVPISITEMSASISIGTIQVDLSYDASLLHLSTCTTLLTDERRATCVQTAPGALTIRIGDAEEITTDSLIAQIQFDLNNRSQTPTTTISIQSTQMTNATGRSINPNVENGLIYFDCISGDVNCDGNADIIDAQHILQHTVALRDRSDALPLQDGFLHLPTCDVNADNSCDPLDGLLIYQCSLGITNAFCTSEIALQQGAHSRAAKVYLSVAPEMVEVDHARVPIIATISDGKLGIMTVDVSYTGQQWAVSDCIADPGNSFDIAVCNPGYQAPGMAESAVRLSVLAAGGISGEIKVGEVNLRRISGQTATLPGPPVMGIEATLSTDNVGVEVELLDKPDDGDTPIAPGHQIMLPLIQG